MWTFKYKVSLLVFVFSFEQRNYDMYVKGNYSALVNSFLLSQLSQSIYFLEVESMSLPYFLPLNEKTNVITLWFSSEISCMV